MDSSYCSVLYVSTSTLVVFYHFPAEMAIALSRSRIVKIKKMVYSFLRKLKWFILF